MRANQRKENPVSRKGFDHFGRDMALTQKGNTLCPRRAIGDFFIDDLIPVNGGNKVRCDAMGEQCRQGGVNSDYERLVFGLF